MQLLVLSIKRMNDDRSEDAHNTWENGVDEMEERQRKRRGQHSLDGRSGVYHDDRDCLKWSVKCVWEQETSK